MYTYSLHNEQRFVQFVLSGLDWTGLTSDPLRRTGLDQDHRLTDLDWTGFFQMNPFHTLVVTTRLWNKDCIRILQRSYKPILSACFLLKTVGSNIFLNLTVLPFNKKTTRFPVTMALVQEVHNRVHSICLPHVIRGRSTLGETLRRIVAPNAVRLPRPVPSAVSAGSYPISVEHSPPSLEADWILSRNSPTVVCLRFL